MTTHQVAIPLAPPTGGSAVLDLEVTLDTPANRIAVRSPGAVLGRADAVLGRQTWAAKHYWTEGNIGDEVTVFEFDEALPVGPIHLRIPAEVR